PIGAIYAGQWPLTRLGLFFDDQPELSVTLPQTAVWPKLEAIGLEWSYEEIDEPKTFAPTLERIGARSLIPNPLWDGVPLYQVGQALRDNRRFTDAFVCFDLGIIESPEDPDMWLEHGNLHEELGRKPEAAASWRRGLELDANHYGCTHNLAGLLRFED